MAWCFSTRASIAAVLSTHPCVSGSLSVKTPSNAIWSWWRYEMETFSALLAICAGNSPVPGEFPTQRPVTQSFDVFFDLRLNKRLSKQSWGWWFEMPSHPLWRHHKVLHTIHHRLEQNSNQRLNSYKTTQTSPHRWAMGCLLWHFWGKLQIVLKQHNNVCYKITSDKTPLTGAKI